MQKKYGDRDIGTTYYILYLHTRIPASGPLGPETRDPRPEKGALLTKQKVINRAIQKRIKFRSSGGWKSYNMSNRYCRAPGGLIVKRGDWRTILETLDLVLLWGGN